MAAHKVPLAIRFWNKVNKSGPIIRPELGPCWVWMANRLIGRGYGLLKHQRKTLRAHRVAYQLTYGPIPDGLWVLHKCDHPPCVRPDHLYAGTIVDNARDALERGLKCGKRLGGARGDDEVRAIRARYAAGGISQKELAAIYHTNQGSISKVINRRRWKNI